MRVTDEQLRALRESERFLRQMTTWALPSDVRSELDRLLNSYTGLSRQPDLARPAATVPAAPVVKLAMSHASIRDDQPQPFPGNLREPLPEWAAAGPDECPPVPFDIDEARTRIKLVYCETIEHWFDYTRESELGGLQPCAAIEFFDGAEALRQILWRFSNPRYSGDASVRRVAFLGIDGVLYPKTRRPPNSFESLKRRVDANDAVERMARCLDSGGMDVVVHSHWRKQLTRAQLLELLGMPDGGFGGTSGCALCSEGSFLIGTTLSTLDGVAGIHDAVARMRLGADDYIVIDTDAELLAAFADQAVPCDASRGTDDAFVDALYERVGVTLVRV
jgi:hypothetical protein